VTAEKLEDYMLTTCVTRNWTMKMKYGWAEAFVNNLRPIRRSIKEDEDHLFA
ncbi:MAG: hypothetical protein ACI8RD_013070, partial [Bacillariaceae sp.]